MDGWKLILSFPFGSANVQFRGAVQLQGVLWIRFGQQHFAQISGLTVSGPPKRRIVGELTIPDLPSWQPGDVLYFEEKNPPKEGPNFKQNKGHLGSRIISPWFFRGCVFLEGFVFFFPVFFFGPPGRSQACKRCRHRPAFFDAGWWFHTFEPFSRNKIWGEQIDGARPTLDWP